MYLGIWPRRAVAAIDRPTDVRMPPDIGKLAMRMRTMVPDGRGCCSSRRQAHGSNPSYNWHRGSVFL